MNITHNILKIKLDYISKVIINLTKLTLMLNL